MIINTFLNEMRIYESTSDFLTIQQNIVDLFKHNNARSIVTRLFNNYKDFVLLVKGQDKEEKPSKKETKIPPETAMGKKAAAVEDAEGEEDNSIIPWKPLKTKEVEKPKEAEKPKKETEKPNLEAAVAVLIKRVTGENIQLDLDRYYTASGKKQSDILSDTKLLKTITDIKKASITDEKRLMMPLFQVNIKLDEFLSNKRHTLSIPEKQKIVLAVFWILLLDGKYIPSEEKLEQLVKRYGQNKSFKSVTAKNKADKKKADTLKEKETEMPVE